MHLRSGRHLGADSRSEVASRVPTLGSGTRSVGNLETICEDISSDTDSDLLSSNESEMSQQSQDMHAPTMPDLGEGTNNPNPFKEMPIELEYNMSLKFAFTNIHNAYIFKDPFERYVVKLADTDTPLEQKPWVNYQRDSYMGKHGDRYLVVPDPGNVDNMACEVEPDRTKKPVDQPGPSIPNTTRPGMQNLFSDLNKDPNFPVVSKHDKGDKGKDKAFDLDMIMVDRVPQDDLEREVYQDKVGNFYGTTKHPMDWLPEKHIIYGETMGDSKTRYKDNMGHEYVLLGWEEILSLSFNGIPCFADFSPRATARPEDSTYFDETVAPKPRAFGTKETPVQGREKPRASRGPPTFEPSAPPIATPRKSRPPPVRESHRTMGHSAIPEPPRPTTRPREDHFPMGGRGPRRREDEYARKVRPSTLQKLVKKYDGSRDPYDHIATFRQVVHTEQVTDYHTQIEGFGLTLEGKALSWFHTLEPQAKETP